MNKKKVALVVTSAVCLISWLAVGVGLAIGVSKTAAIVLIILALVISEVLFWVVAVVLGVSMLESRKQIFAWLRLKLGLKA